jgi:hypothetical protein
MESPRRYPRTLQEAFGPHTSRHVHVDAPRASLRAWAAYLAIVAIALACAALTGCWPAMTNDSVIAEVKKCHDAGMNAKLYRNEFRPGITHVVCTTQGLT